MTLLETIRYIESIAVLQPAVNTIVRADVRRLNDLPNIRYGVFAWVQGVHTESADNDIARYTFSLFYVDRLTAKKENATEVQSVGCEVLGSILRYINEYGEGIQVAEWSLHPFEYRFKDECAGVYAECSIDVPVSLPCGDVYEFVENIGDFNADFNEDFNCWQVQAGDREILIY